MKTVAKLREMPHWSYSALQCYLSCPLKYKFRYIDNAEPERTGSCFPFGRAFHAALSERARIGKDMSEREVCDVFEDFFKVECEAAQNLTYKQNEDYDTLLQSGFRMVEAVCENWMDDYAVQSVAESFSVNVPGLSKPLIGEFDCVVTDGKDTCIVDWKTSSAKWAVGKADKDLQATAFCYAFKAKHGEKPLIGEFDCVVTDGKDTCIVDWKTSSAKWAVGKADKDLQATAFCYAFKAKHGEKPLFRFDVITKAKTPTVNNHYTLRTDDELNRFVSLTNSIEKSVNSGSFYPNETGFGCGECPYADRCKKWR